MNSGGTPSKVPGRYIPVGQGFFVVADNGGTINFNNGQRLFKKETIPNGEFIRSANASSSNTNATSTQGDLRPKIKFGFSSAGNIHRQLLLTIDEDTTPGVDWGYDAVTYEYLDDDMFWGIENNFYVIQASDNMDVDTSYPLIVYTATDGINKIMIDELMNIDDEQEIYLHDIELGFYHNLKEDGNYEIFLNAGYYDGRFEIVFSNENTSLGTDDDILNEENSINLYYSKAKGKLVLLNPKGIEISNIEIYSILGQLVNNISDIKPGNYSEYTINGLSTAPYIIRLTTDKAFISKKIIVNK